MYRVITTSDPSSPKEEQAVAGFAMLCKSDDVPHHNLDSHHASR